MKLKLIIACLSTAAALNTAQAQTPSSTSMNPAPTSDALYQAFGEKAGLTQLMDRFMVGLLADARTAPFFVDANQSRVKMLLVEQLCQESGGPCAYTGRSMTASHGNMGVEKSHFNALVEVLQQAMGAQGISFSAQNQMLARLAPMHRDIIAK